MRSTDLWTGGGGVPEYSGRLELTWTNKHLRLLAHEGGSYEWVSPSDYRVAEVRLLNDAGTTGEVRPDGERAKDNLLMRGDALAAVTSLTKIPEFRDEYVGKVRLVYLDPPFNTGQAFEQYDDALEHSVWLTMMRDRLTQIKKLLAKDGSIWVHLNDDEMAYCRILLDEVFGRSSFVATIVWESAQGGRGDTDIAPTHDYILVYAKDKPQWAKVRNGFERTSTQLARFANPDNDPRGPWRQGDDGTAKSGSEKSRFPITLPSGRVIRPKEGRYWAFSQGTFERARAEGRVWFGKKGNSLPVIKRYATEVKETVAPKTWWPAAEAGSNQEAKRDHLNKMFPGVTPFATPKPERLMERIIHIATNPGDIVLDCFAGSGTTAAVSQKMGRRWVAVEWSQKTLATFTGPRLTKVVRGEDPGGITELTGWEGGGGFRVLDVAPSMFEDDEGHVVLADWATSSALAEATAAQLGYDYDPEMLPFCGRKGRSRLAVIDGLVNEDVARLLVEQLPENEMVVLCATMVDPAAQAVVSEARKGSRLRKIPDSILADYRRSQLWWERRMAELYAEGEAESAEVAEPAEAVEA